MSRVYKADELPEGVSWLNTLTAEHMRQQCAIMGLESKQTLEENRAMMRQYFRELKKSEDEAQPVGPTPPQNQGQTQQAPAADTDPMAIALAVAREVGTSIAQALNNKPATASGQVPDVCQHMAKNIPITTGSDPKLLVEFLLVVTRIHKLKLITDDKLLTLVLPRTASHLSVRWAQAIADQQKFGQLCPILLDLFVPHQIKHALLSTMLYRAQGPSEILADFVQIVIEVADLLLPELGEQQLLQILLTGINPATRSCFGGFPHPNSVQELLDMSPRVLAVGALHASKGAAEAEHRQHAYQPSGYRGFTRPPWAARGSQRQGPRHYAYNQADQQTNNAPRGHHSANQGNRRSLNFSEARH